MVLLLLPIPTKADLVIAISEPKISEQKAVIKLDMKNTSSQKLKRAKGKIFLLDAAENVVGQPHVASDQIQPAEGAACPEIGRFDAKEALAGSQVKSSQTIEGGVGR
jgi:hypothetical protein